MPRLKVSTILKWVTGGLEAFLGIPILGGLFILSSAWTPLLLMLILHTTTLIFASNEYTYRHGSIVGIIASCLGVIPVVGMLLHITAALLLLIDAFRSTMLELNG